MLSGWVGANIKLYQGRTGTKNGLGLFYPEQPTTATAFIYFSTGNSPDNAIANLITSDLKLEGLSLTLLVMLQVYN